MKGYHIARRLSKNVPTSYEFQFYDKSGNKKDVLAQISFLKDMDLTITSMTDITRPQKNRRGAQGFWG